MNVTLSNIDLTNPACIDHVVASLRAYATIPEAYLSAVQDITIDFAQVMEGPSERAPAADALAIYGAKTRPFLETMLARIAKQGSTTLEDAATEAGISLDTARAYLRNAGRTAAAHKVALPVAPKWDHEKGRNDYAASGA